MIEIVMEDAGWREILPEAEDFAARCHEAARRFEPALDGAVALLLADDGALEALNARYRDKPEPTNVLSFPAGPNQEGLLGDVALARGRCVVEAGERGVAPADHAAHLIVHGLLHLIGYDHQNDADAEAMERREAEILAALGIADPYAG